MSIQPGYIVSLVFMALFWVSALYVPGGRGEALMCVNGLLGISVAMLTYLRPRRY